MLNALSESGWRNYSLSSILFEAGAIGRFRAEEIAAPPGLDALSATLGLNQH
jgi:hypothetical protein